MQTAGDINISCLLMLYELLTVDADDVARLMAPRRQ